jgi:hypothetical protein
MAIKTVRIHPAIGIARLGDSPSDFFIGPERPLDRTPPPGGYKDANCKIKRQAARFRLVAYDESNALVKELTVADGDITWTAHLVNRKAAGLEYGNTSLRNPSVVGAARDKLVIEPGARSVTGAAQRALFDTGTFELPGAAPKTVPLGELRTDTDGHLLVLGGSGTSGSPKLAPLGAVFNSNDWHDDISDGPVSASIKIGADTIVAEGAWVIVAPPKYAPPIDHAVTLYDRLQQFFIDHGLLPAFADPSPSYSRYIYPILQRAKQVAWVESIPGYAHKDPEWSHPVTADIHRSKLFAKLRKSDGTGGDMPYLLDYTDPSNWVHLTDTQYKIMEKWKDNSFTNDWAGEPGPDPAITPEGLDMAALENCVGSAFFPGIEAGEFLISDPALYSRAFRLDPAKVKPGDVTARMALPWQSDFFACQKLWWPPARPNSVRPEGGGAAVDWSAAVPDRKAMVDHWSELGFVLRSGDEYLLTEACAPSFVHLLTPQLVFKDIPRGPMGMSRKTALAIVFEVRSPAAAVTLEFKSGPVHPRLQRLGATSVSVGPTAGIVHARLWLTYETGAPGESITDSVTVTRPGTTEEWVIKLSASTVERKKSAAALVLDRSGSMAEDMGGGTTRIQGLREAAQIFVDVMLQDDGVALVRFNQAADELKPVTVLGSPADPFDPGRAAIKASITGPDLNPAGQTSIGAGIVKGRTALNSVTGFDFKSMLVFTDGKENHAPLIADVAAQLSERTYAVGLGTPANISAAGLQTISGNSGGYFLMTGGTTPENRFLLQKYFLQILAGISNADIALDPSGELEFGESQEIPFWITEADAGMDVILLSPYAGRIRFRLRSPIGEILDPGRAAGRADALFVQSVGVSYYRVCLPLELFPGRPDRAGRWHALLDFGQPGPGQTGSESRPREAVIIANAAAVATGMPFRAIGAAGSGSTPAGTATQAVGARAQGALRAPYSVLVHTYSDLRLTANATQDTLAPGARVTLTASLLLYGAPLTAPAQVWADVTRPDGSTFRLDFTSPREGEFDAAFNTSLAGVYAIRVHAAGSSPLGHSVRREMALTALCRIGSDPGVPPSGPMQPLCELLLCGLQTGALSDQWIQRLREQGVDIPGLLNCLCRGTRPTGDTFPDV